MGKKKQSAADKTSEAPPLRLEWRSPAELAENPSNWRRHPESQISALTDAIAEVGWAGACLYNERTRRLIDGHARKKVALDQGAPLIPVLIGDWDEATEKKILATLDPLSAMALADKDRLDALLREVSTGSEALRDMLAGLATRSRAATEGSNGADDVAEIYQGMPEFQQDDINGKFRVNVYMETEADRADFARLIGQKLSDRAVQCIWHPARAFLPPRQFIVEDGDEP